MPPVSPRPDGVRPSGGAPATADTRPPGGAPATADTRPFAGMPGAGGAQSAGGTQRTRVLPALSRKTRQILAAVLAVVAIALLAWGLFGPQGTGTAVPSEAERISYQQFSSQLDAGQVATATIGSEQVVYTLVEDAGAGEAGARGDATGAQGTAGAAGAQDDGVSAGSSSAVYVTDNPGADDFKERLLMHGVVVTDNTGAASAPDVLDQVLNWLFYLLFFGVAGYGAYRMLSYARTTFPVVRSTGVTFDDIAGLDRLKTELRRAVDALKNPDVYRGRGVRPVKGIVLEGPPGNGKTLLARALAQEAGVSFIASKGADFQSALMSLGARKIRALFRRAARHRPCIVFIDEFDAIGERRNYGGMGIDKENNRIITAMLNEMDGFSSSDGILVVAATNSYRSLDPALVRPGRFDLKFTVDNPDAATRAQLVALYVAGRGHSLAPDVTIAALVDAFAGLSSAAIETVLNGAAMIALDHTDEHSRSAAGEKPGRAASAADVASTTNAASTTGRERAITWEMVRAAAAAADVQLHA